MKSFSQAAAEVTGALTAKPRAGLPERRTDAGPHACSAYGCPLAGSVSASTRGDGTWWCFWHFQASERGEGLPEVTKRIRAGELPDNSKPPKTAWFDDRRHLLKRRPEGGDNEN